MQESQEDSLLLSFSSKNARKESLLRLFGNKSEPEYVPAELDLMLYILEHFSLTGTERNPIQDERVLHVFWRENKPAPLQEPDQQMTRRELRNLAEIGLRKSSFRSDDITVFAGIADSFRANLQEGRIFRLAPGGRAHRTRCGRLDQRRRSRGQPSLGRERRRGTLGRSCLLIWDCRCVWPFC